MRVPCVSPKLPASFVRVPETLGGLLGGLLDGFDFQGEVDFFADQEAAGLEGLVPFQAEVPAVDAGGGVEAGALAAPGILAAALEGGVEDDGPGHSVEGQVAGDPVAVAALVLDLRAAEGSGGELLH